MSSKSTLTALALGGFMALGTFAYAQNTVTYTNRWGDRVTDTRSLQNGEYINNKTVTAPNGKTYTRDKTSYVNGNGHVITQATRTGPNGKSVTSASRYGRYGKVTRVTGPNGGTRHYRRPR
jgi:hypothetical protein